MKKILIIVAYVLVLGIVVFIGRDRIAPRKNEIKVQDDLQNVGIGNEAIDNEIIEEKVIDDWRLILVNSENSIPEDYEFELVSIDRTRKVDKRIQNDLTTMIDNMRKDGITNIWVQSAYRDESLQTTLFNDKVAQYMKQGNTRDEAEKLTMQIINKPGTSEHNLGLSVDFNYVNREFETTSAFKWLQKNGKEYGFILRYRKDKEEITKVDYEPWHWRYVGKENAEKIEELDMCLEEYIEYLKKN